MPDLRRHPAYTGLKRFRGGWLALLAATMIALYLCWRMLQPFVEVPLWAAVLVIVFYPVHQDLLRRTGRPSLSALLSCILVATVILLPLTFITIIVAEEAVRFALELPANYERLFNPNSRPMQLLARFGLEDALTREKLETALTDIVPQVVRGGGGLALTILITLLKTFFVVFTMYYLFRDAERVRDVLRKTLPLQPAQSERIFARTREVINASVHGVLVIAILQGILGGLAWWILGLPSPLLWGSVMVLLSTIPLIGSTVVWVPTAIYLAATGSYGKALFLVAWGTLVIASADNFLRPRLVGGKTRLHELLVFFSVVGGLKVFGILGIVVGPVVVAITLALLDVFRNAEQPLQQSVAAGGTEPTLAEIQSNLREVPPEQPAGAPPTPDNISPDAPAPAPPDADPLGKGHPSPI